MIRSWILFQCCPWPGMTEHCSIAAVFMKQVLMARYQLKPVLWPAFTIWQASLLQQAVSVWLLCSSCRATLYHQKISVHAVHRWFVLRVAFIGTCIKITECSR